MTIEGIPDGWELVRIGRPFINERYISLSGKVTNCVCIPSGEAYAIVRKIEKPKKPKRYRPFANAAEYKPHRCRWVSHKSNPDSCMRIDGYGNNGVTIQGCVHDFDVMFEDCTFDDGTPFGIEVTE